MQDQVPPRWIRVPRGGAIRDAQLQESERVIIGHRSREESKRGPVSSPCRCGGEGGIRTHGTASCTPDFESGPFDHSGTSPRRDAILQAKTTFSKWTRGQKPGSRRHFNPDHPLGREMMVRGTASQVSRLQGVQGCSMDEHAAKLFRKPAASTRSKSEAQPNE